MAIEWESSCVDCPSLGLPCRGSSCSNNKDYPVLKCDKCKYPADVLFEVDGDQLCEDCLLENFTMIRAEDLV